MKRYNDIMNILRCVSDNTQNSGGGELSVLQREYINVYLVCSEFRVTVKFSTKKTTWSHTF